MKTATFAVTVAFAAGAAIAAPVAAPQAGTYGASQILKDLGIEGTVSQSGPSTAPGVGGGVQGVTQQETNINIPGQISGDQFNELIGRLGGNNGLGKPPALQELEDSIAASQFASAAPPAQTLSAAPIGGPLPEAPAIPPVPSAGQTGSSSRVNAVANAAPENSGSQVSSANDGNGNSALACASSNGEPLSPECQKAAADAQAAVEQATQGIFGSFGNLFNSFKKRQVNAIANVGPGSPGSQQVSQSDGNGNSASAFASTDGSLPQDFQLPPDLMQFLQGMQSAGIQIPGFPFGLKKRQVNSSSSVGGKKKGSQSNKQCDSRGNCASSFASNDGSLPPNFQIPPQFNQFLTSLRSAGIQVPGFPFSINKRAVTSSSSVGPNNKGTVSNTKCDKKGNCASSSASNTGAPLNANSLPPQVKQFLQSAGIKIPGLNFKRAVTSSSSIGPNQKGSVSNTKCDKNGNCASSSASNNGSASAALNSLPPQMRQFLASLGVRF